MFKKKSVIKFLFRWLVVTVVFLLVKVTMEHDIEIVHPLFSAPMIYYYCTAFFLFMVTWEFNDWLIIRQLKNGGLDLKSSLQILAKSMAVLLPFSVLFYYLALYPFKEYIGHPTDEPFVCFMRDVLRATVLGLAVISFNLLYHSMRQRDEMKKQLEDLQRENLASKYTSLKNQISPHFLFNSLNTLTSLMYSDRDLASDFVSRLASSYRYILDNREEDLVSLEKELNFLDAFVFMMDVRHKEAVIININVNAEPKKYVVPTLSLQMLVENALKHNYYSKEKPLRIDISCIENDALVVRNTLRKRKLDEETTKLGLKNIKKRYSYYTSKDVLIREEEEFYEVILPLLKTGQNELNLLAVS